MQHLSQALLVVPTRLHLAAFPPEDGWLPDVKQIGELVLGHPESQPALADVLAPEPECLVHGYALYALRRA